MADKPVALELGIEFVVELLLFLYPFGADQMNLPHNFWLGLGCWIVATAIGIRMFWIFPYWAKRLTTTKKSLIAMVAVAVFSYVFYKPVAIAYGKRNADTEVATPKSSPIQTTTSSLPPQSTSPAQSKPAEKKKRSGGSQSATASGNNNTAGNLRQDGNGNNAAIGNSNVVGNGNNVGNTYYGSGDSGWLVPANDPTPANGCAEDVIAQGGFIVFLGSMAAGASRMPNIVMKAGGKPRITLDVNERGELAVTADIFDSKDDIVVELDRNKYTVSNDAFRVEKPDPSTLTVTVKHQKEKVLNVRFMNKHAIRVLGHFRYPGSPDLVADESRMDVGGIRMGGDGCMVNSGQGMPDFEF